jgi:hypothetical protein
VHFAAATKDGLVAPVGALAELLSRPVAEQLLKHWELPEGAPLENAGAEIQVLLPTMCLLVHGKVAAPMKLLSELHRSHLA